MKPIVAIVGRPNVGKSTLFNRIIKKRLAIVDNQSGVTRDRHYTDTEWAGREFVLIDTGGYIPSTSNNLEISVREQAKIAIEEADAIIFLCDVETGVTSFDMELAHILKRAKKPVIPAVNKVDDQNKKYSIDEFYQLGLDNPLPVSAMVGRDIGDLLDRVISELPSNIECEETNKNIVRLAVLGIPNAGKSSFVNAVLNQDKLIVNDIPGTTRDSIDSSFSRHNQEYLIIDTAGLRKRSKLKEGVEFYSTIRTQRSLERCDVALILADAEMNIHNQDIKILERAIFSKKGAILLINKWDLLKKDEHTARLYEKEIRAKLRIHNFIPIIFISALTKQRIYKAIDIAKKVFDERNRAIPTNELNQFFEGIFKHHPPASLYGKNVRLKYTTQIKTSPPVFAFFSNEPNLIKSNYRRFLERKLREQYGFLGVPITVVFKKK